MKMINMWKTPRYYTIDIKNLHLTKGVIEMLKKKGFINKEDYGFPYKADVKWFYGIWHNGELYKIMIPYHNLKDCENIIFSICKEMIKNKQNIFSKKILRIDYIY